LEVPVFEQEFKIKFAMEENKINKISDHLANERTFLAWVRTSIGIMAFGFVVVKFSLFVKEIAIVLGKQIIIKQHGYSNLIGIVLVGAGSCSLLISFVQYKRREKQINSGNFISSSILAGSLIIFIFSLSIFLLILLVNSM
jgi:putative membrane protein